MSPAPSAKPSDKPASGGPPKWVLGAVTGAAVISLTAGGYLLFTSRGGASPVSQLAARATLNPDCEYNDPDLCRYLNRAGAEALLFSNMSVRTTTNGADFSESVFESQIPDRTRMVSFENGKEVFHVISIGNTTYTKDPADGSWWKQTTAPETTRESERINVNEELREYTDPRTVAEKRISFEKSGTEMCGQLTCFRYKIVEPDTEATTTTYIFFDTTDYILRKTVSEMPDGSTSSEYSYGSVKIVEPSPVKELPPNQGFIPSGSQLPPGFEIPESVTEQLEEGFDPGMLESDEPME